MPWIVDGSNLLGRLGRDRESVEGKRDLVRLLSSFARSRSTKVVCVFDGPTPDAFARNLGALTVEFSGSVSADDRIVARVSSAGGSKLTVVTSDQGLAARVRSRRVEIVSCDDFRRQIESMSEADGAGQASEDWESYFSDPKNRNSF